MKQPPVCSAWTIVWAFTLVTAAYWGYKQGVFEGQEKPRPEARTFYAAAHNPTVLKLRYQF